MDELYDNLENYNDFAELEELKKENQELKFKLKEYDSRMEKLQKDFDRVSAEFRTLEINYSSLLKTAKAEIERKTQLISSLNAEKDKLVLSTLQSSNKNIMNIRRNLSRGRVDSVKKLGNETDDSSKKSSLLLGARNRSLERNRNDENRFPSVDTASPVNTDDNKFANKTETFGAYKTTEEPKPMSIKDRRKSMPVFSQVKFSSDEEENNSEDDYDRRRPAREDKSKPFFEQTRDYHDRYNRSDKHKSGRKSQRRKRNFSPDRHRRVDDERHDRRPRFDSPPPDRYDHRNRNRRSNYDRDDDRDKHRTRPETYPFKHKIHGEYEEPSMKRARLEFNPYAEETLRPRKPSEFTEERAPSRNLQHLQHESCQSPDYNSNPDVDSPHPVREIKDNAATFQEDPRLLSDKYYKKCEGDKVVLSTCIGRNVNLIPIQPSLWKQSEKGDKEVMPKALQEMPSNTEDMIKDIYTDIENPVSNMSFESGEILSERTDTATPDLFYGRDEVDRRKECEPDETLTPNVENQINYDSLSHTTSVEYKTEQRLQQHKPVASVENPTEHTNVKHNPTNTVEKTSKYTIPKIKTLDKTKSCTVDKNPLALLMNEIRDAPPVVDICDPVAKSISLPSRRSSKLDVDTVFSRRQAEKKKKESNKKHANQMRESRTSREIVAGDLELSDETSDNIDLHNRVVAEKSSNSKCDEFVNQNKKETSKDVKTVTKNTKEIEPKTSLPDPIETNIDLEKLHQEETDKSTDSKHKSKKKSNKKAAAKYSKEEIKEKKSKHKEKVTEKKDKSKEKFEDNTSKFEEPEKKSTSKEKKGKSKEKFEDNTSKFEEPEKKSTSKEKKDKLKEKLEDNTKFEEPEKKSTSKEVKEKIPKIKDVKTSQKLYDLFGDSSSLITPEDLGLVPVAELDSVPYSSNLALFEDAQHAIDMNMEPKSKPTVIEPKKDRNTESKELTKPEISEKSEPKNLFINLNPSVDDSGVVNTIVISSGVQSQPETHSPTPEDTRNSKDNKNIDLLKNQTVPIALATSTPHKNLLNILNEVESQSVDSSCSLSDNKEVQNDTSSLSSVNGLTSHNVPDAPDVRIFVKRRKKVIKKN